jgi:hypothetical protein
MDSIDSDFQSLPALAEQAYQKMIERTKQAVPEKQKSWFFNISDLRDEDIYQRISTEVKAWSRGSKAAIYYFQSTNREIDLAFLKQRFQDAKNKEDNDKRAYAQLNIESESNCLYVGSSRNIMSRFKQHAGRGAKDTYALQLIHWATDLDLALQFSCVLYPDFIDYEVIQALEDILWSAKKPVFGRQGRK